MAMAKVAEKFLAWASAVLLPMALAAATVAVDPDCLDMGEVTWSEKDLSNGTCRVTMKASARDGFAFGGWLVADHDVVAWPDDWRHPGTLTATVLSNADVVATFAPCSDDMLEFDVSEVFDAEIACGERIVWAIDVDSASFPTLTFTGLPKGLSYDERTLTVFGAPTDPGVYEIEASGVNGSGFTFRSFATVRVANVEGARVSGIDAEIPVGEYFFSEIGNGDASDVFSFSEKPTYVTLSGVVPGLEWHDDWSLLFGTPTTPGNYTLRVKVHFPTGAVETATMTLTVAGADPDDYGIDFGALSDLRIGDELNEPDAVIGANAEDMTIRGVSGLPSGLSAVSWTEGGHRLWGVSGIAREAGRYATSVEIYDASGDAPRVVTVRQTVTVADVPDVYLDAKSDDSARGTVSGGGAISPVADATLVARPRTGNVFAGWYDAYGDPLVLMDGVDYRVPSVTLPAGTDLAFLAPVAHFVAASDDVSPDLSQLEDSDFSIAPDEYFEETFAVESLSLPTLSFKGLPKGMSCSALGNGAFALSYDPSVAEAASGRYAVTATAVNASGEKTTVSFRVTVGNRMDSRIQVDDDYGEFTPGEAIDPIDLSESVDFARGETLSVSGLPRGLSYNAKANAKKAIDAYTITGVPTTPGDYTLKFAARVVMGAKTNKSGKVSYAYGKASATAFMTVLPYPELVLDVDEDALAAGCKVTGAGNYKAGTKVSLKATAAKGWVFAGWEGLDDLGTFESLNPKLSYVSGEDDVWAQACFTTIDQDGLMIYAPESTESGCAAEWALKEVLDENEATLVADLVETVSWPTVKVDGLPSGVKFTASTLLLSGKPTKSGIYHVTVTAKNAGGYSFVRVFDVAVLNADGTLPTEALPANAAAIDFEPLQWLTSGVHCPTGAVVLAVGAKPGTGVAVKKVAVSGMPAGLVARTTLVGDGAVVEVTGTPAKPGRKVVSVSVSYADGKTLKSQAAVVVEDGGSEYLFVSSDDSDAGTVSGEGVYASGATVKLVAKPKSKHAFAGWHALDGDGNVSLFAPLREIDGIDPRTASVTFPFRPADFVGGYKLAGAFVGSADVSAATIDLESEVWSFDPAETSTFAFYVDSLSVPKAVASGLPKGVTVNAARGRMTYTPTASATPGIYAATLFAKNATQTKTTERTFEVRVANRISEAIGGLDADMDAYLMTVGAAIDSSLIVPTVEAGWTLTAKGLPSGLSFKGGAVTGTPKRVGDYTVTFTATFGKGKAKKTEISTITLRISANLEQN